MLPAIIGETPVNERAFDFVGNRNWLYWPSSCKLPEHDDMELRT